MSKKIEQSEEGREHILYELEQMIKTARENKITLKEIAEAINFVLGKEVEELTDNLFSIYFTKKLENTPSIRKLLMKDGKK